MLQVKMGPMPLTSATFRTCFPDNSENRALKFHADEKISLTIKRKPVYAALRELPNNFEMSKKNINYIERITRLCSKDNRRAVTVEDLRDFVRELSEVEFEFPRHLMEPLFHLCNEKLYQAIESDNIYCLEVLLDTLSLMQARNIVAEEKHEDLKHKAIEV